MSAQLSRLVVAATLLGGSAADLHQYRPVAANEGASCRRGDGPLATLAGHPLGLIRSSSKGLQHSDVAVRSHHTHAELETQPPKSRATSCLRPLGDARGDDRAGRRDV